MGREIELQSADPSREPRELSREALRAALIQRIPRWYSPWLHLSATTGIGVAVLALALSNLHSVSLWELLMVPSVFCISNAVEWLAHRYLLHRRTWPMHVLYDRHTPEHHRVYQVGDMAIRDWRELRLVLIPATGVLGIVLVMVPGALLAATLLGSNAGWLFLLTSSGYVVSYELTHLIYHMPKEHRLARLAWVRVMRNHHATHHDPSLMRSWNFNVTVPLADWVLGTWFKAGKASPQPKADRDARGLSRNRGSYV
ncbi:MAG TPA: sterol desaturase family protein [Polyangiaceae bacterium]